MVLKKIPSWAVVLLLLIVIVAVAFWLRVLLPYNQVFTADWIKFTGVDAYYYMRLLDNLSAHFPQLTQFDPYFIFPGGISTVEGQPTFYAYFMGAIVWLIGLGRPDQHLVDIISPYIPPLLAILTVVAVYFIGKAVENDWVGLLAAAMLAVLPGEFLNRSLLGYTDHHIAEVLWSTLTMMFFMLAIKRAKAIDYAYLKQNGWRVVVKPAILSILAGIALGLYMLTWPGAALFLLIIVIFMLIQAIVDYMSGGDVICIPACGLIVFMAGLAVYLPGEISFFTLLSLLGGIGLTIALIVIAWLVGKYSHKRIYYPLSLVVLGILGALVFYLVAPATLNSMYERLMGVFTWPTNTTVMEMQPLLLQQGEFTLLVAIGNYTSGLFLGVAGLALLVYRAYKKHEPLEILLLVWSLIILFAALAMRRFSYYLAVNIAVLSGYFVWWILSLAGFGRQAAPAQAAPVTVRKKASRRREAQAVRKQQGQTAIKVLTLIVVLTVMIYPNLGPWLGGEKPAQDLATRPLFAPPDEWCESLDWLRQNTPEPFGNEGVYYGLYRAPSEPGGFIYPETAYGVMAWWDYGYWISRIGRRVPYMNPGTGATKGEARYFMAQDEAAAGKVIKDANIRYVIIDNQIAAYDGKLHALCTLSGGSYADYYDMYLLEQNDKYVPVIRFYPEFYRSMVIRLYNFDGKEVIPRDIEVIGYKAIDGGNGQIYKAITEQKKFTTYQEAADFINSQKAGSYRIVSDDPLRSPVPLEPLKSYSLLYGSPQKSYNGQNAIPKVKIFEYTP